MAQLTPQQFDVAIIREPDDKLRDAHISMGQPKGRPNSFYLVFRGEPAAVIELLEKALLTAQYALPQGKYQDKRGRPQG